MLTVSNSSPLIALSAISRLDLLPALFSSISIPPAVAAEIAPSIPSRPDWLLLVALNRPIPSTVVRPGLGQGEREALSLGIELQADYLIIDDWPARRAAQAVGLQVIGTLGVLLAGKRRALIDSIGPSAEALRQHGFFMSPKLYEQFLQLAGEAKPETE